MDIYSRIKALRESHGISQDELAKMVGYKDRSSIAKVEAGRVDLSQSKIALFSKALGVSPAYLLGIEEKQSTQAMLLSQSDCDLLTAYHSAPKQIKDIVDVTLGPYLPAQVKDEAM